MTELVGRLLSFEERNGRGLVRLVFYLLLFVLVVTSAWEMTKSFSDMSDAFWTNLWRILVTIPFKFLVLVLLLRLGAEVVIAIFSISESLQSGAPEGDVMSSGLNLGGLSPMDEGAPVRPIPRDNADTEPTQKPSPDQSPGETTPED